MSDFDSLTLAFDEWFDRPMGDLPEALRLRAEQELKPYRWEDLSPEQRRSLTLQLDYQHDPATEKERRDWFLFFHRMSELEQELERQGSNARVNLADLLDDSGPLKDIRDQIRRMKARYRQVEGNYYPQRRVPVEDLDPGKYMAYPKALHHLRQRLESTPEELAAWVWLGPQAGGLSAYLNVNELDTPPQFYFGALPYLGHADEEDSDYVAPLMGCWFRSDDIVNFQPADRFITGAALIERWSSVPDLKVEPFVRAKIRESRLFDLHPIYGGTQAGGSDGSHLPPMTEGLFRVADVEAIEAEDFAAAPAPARSASGSPGSAGDAQADLAADPGAEPAPNLPANPLLSVFRELRNLRADELIITFVGDRAEQGLAANSMIEISARGISRRVSLAHLDLVDRRTGALNGQGAILLGMRKGQRIPYTEANAKKVSRLRQTIRSNVGVEDPFDTVAGSRGWEPRFTIEDRRGAADERAKVQGERRTRSLDQLSGLGVPDDPGALRERPFEAEGDDADDWLRKHDLGDSD